MRRDLGVNQSRQAALGEVMLRSEKAGEKKCTTGLDNSGNIEGVFYRIDVGPDNPVHTDVEHLFGDPVALPLVRWNTDDGRYRRRDATLRDLAAVQHTQQPLLQRPDVIGTVLHFEQRAVVGGVGAGGPIGRRRADEGDIALL